MYEKLGKLLSSLHSLDVGTKFGELSKSSSDQITLETEFSSNADFIKSIFESSLSTFLSLNGPEHTVDLIHNFLSQSEHILHSCQAPSLCHNDFHEVISMHFLSPIDRAM